MEGLHALTCSLAALLPATGTVGSNPQPLASN
jgi:hypothetical protein